MNLNNLVDRQSQRQALPRLLLTFCLSLPYVALISTFIFSSLAFHHTFTLALATRVLRIHFCCRILNSSSSSMLLLPFDSSRSHSSSRFLFQLVRSLLSDHIRKVLRRQQDVPIHSADARLVQPVHFAACQQQRSSLYRQQNKKKVHAFSELSLQLLSLLGLILLR